MTIFIRAAQPTDAGRSGEILWENSQTHPWMPALFSCAEAIACCGRMIDRGWVTVALVDGRVEAFLARDGEEIASLYVSPDVNRRGLGRMLLRDAMDRTAMLRLQVHPENSGAARLYQRMGFQETGQSNDSGTPAIDMCWRKDQAA